jgi:hypothetical protein
MLIEAPSPDILLSCLGDTAMRAWNEICDFIHRNYDMESLWDNGGKYGKYVLRFKKAGKTLCTLYVQDNQFGCWIIFGKSERDKFEEKRAIFTDKIRTLYDDTAVYHDGKWVMLEVSDDYLVGDIEKMILIKKKPNKKHKFMFAYKDHN